MDIKNGLGWFIPPLSSRSERKRKTGINVQNTTYIPMSTFYVEHPEEVI